MSKAVLISIRPEWCETIINGQKTIEVRKTRPKMNPPFKCYIYKCGNGKVIGEFLCDQIIEDRTYGHNEEFYRAACMSAYDAAAYAMQSPMYGWHISDLRVYDHPRDLWEFTGLRETKFGLAPGPITRPPQSWRYVEEELWND
jgi:predicted transcriptional regulator